MTGKPKDPTARELAEAVVRKNKLLDEILNSQFQLQGFGTTFTMGQDINPNVNHVRYVLKQLWVHGYADQYNLLPNNMPVEKLGTELPKEVVLWLVPVVLQNVERKTMTGQIDILATNNRSLVYIMDILGWFWFHSLGGPAPELNLLLRSSRSRVVQNEALVCPVCHLQYKPSDKCKTQEAKAWEFVEWLPTHMVEFHRYSPPTRIKAWVKKTALRELEKFKLEIKSHPELYKQWFHK